MSTETERRIELVALSQLVKAPRNPKVHDVPAISGSVLRFGYVEPVVEDQRTGRLVAGHGRLDTLQDLHSRGKPRDWPEERPWPPEGLVERDGEWLVPVYRGWASKNDDEASAYLLASNQMTTVGGWETEGLSQLLQDLAANQVDITGLGWRQHELDALLAADWTPPDFEPLEGFQRTDTDKFSVKFGPEHPYVTQAVERYREDAGTTLPMEHILNEVCKVWLGGGDGEE